MSEGIAEATRRDRIARCAAAVLCLAALACRGDSDPPLPAPSFVGTATCAGCHAAEAARWEGSHHDLAMQAAGPGTVLGDFAGTTWVQGSDTTGFRRDGDRFIVRARGADGKASDHRVAYTFGAFPLQQYLVPSTGGRYQVLGIAWDARPADQGGQQWFHLYPETGADPDSPLHWTRPAQTWNTGCAACHSTGLDVGFDTSGLSFETSWAEMDVACEACHGPGSAHVARARNPTEGQEAAGWGLTVDLAPPPGTWTRPEGAATAHRTSPLTSRAELQVCAPCHSRRAPVSGSYLPGDPFLDAFEPSLLRDGLYHPDGQIHDEVYVYGSFVQSRMYRAGVTCSDCHDPHGLGLRAEGNALCTRCHGGPVYDTRSHHLHDPESSAARCVACHMPATTYMTVDPRRDHGLRIPRPDVAQALGTPDACTGCHADRTTEWAAQVLEARFGPRDPATHFATALQGGRRQDPEAFEALTTLAADTAHPAIVRATALWLLGGYRRAAVPEAVRRGLSDTDPLARIGALAGLEGRPLGQLTPQLRALLDDPYGAVRLRAARLLLSMSPALAAPEEGGATDAAWREVSEAHRANAGNAASWVDMADLHAARGAPAEAEAALRTALALDSTDLPALLNLADLQRAAGRDDLGAATLEGALRLHPEAAEVHHAIGLLRVRQGELLSALEPMAYAAAEGRENPRFGYVYGVARAAVGDTARAVTVLEDVLEDHPWDADVLAALVSYLSARGAMDDAARYAERLVAVTPDDPGARALLARLRARVP